MKNKYIFTIVMLLVIIGVVFTLVWLGSDRGNSDVVTEDSQETMSDHTQDAESGTDGSNGEEWQTLPISYLPDEETLLANEFVIVTTIDPVYAAILNIVGDTAGVRVARMGANTGHMHHGYHMTPDDMILLSEADIFIINGGGIEDFLSNAFETFPNLPVLDTFEEMQASVLSPEPIVDQDFAINNPHIWLNMELYKLQVETITEGLSQADELRRNFYERNAASYYEKIDALIAQVAPIRESLNVTSVVVLGEAFGWLAEEIGLNVLGSVDIDEERPVDAGEVRNILAIINENEISLVFADDVYGRGFGRILEGETDVHILYLDALLHGEPGPDHWLNGMEHNLSILREIQ